MRMIPCDRPAGSQDKKKEQICHQGSSCQRRICSFSVLVSVNGSGVCLFSAFDQLFKGDIQLTGKQAHQGDGTAAVKLNGLAALAAHLALG